MVFFLGKVGLIVGVGLISLGVSTESSYLGFIGGVIMVVSIDYLFDSYKDS